MKKRTTPLVLVVDPDSEELGELYALLDRQGYLVATRREGVEALKYVARSQPDLVIFRFSTDGRDGARLDEAMYQICPMTRVMLLRRAGSTLETPFGRERLLAAVKGVLSQPQQERMVFEPAVTP
jgi:DNA-binding response OmpR family regulator